MLNVFLRTILIYVLVVTAVRLMGKREVGQLQPAELVIMIMIAEVASVPMQNLGLPLISGIVPVLTLVIAEVILSFITLKSTKTRRIMSGTPSILIRNGNIDQVEMKKLRFSIDDLLEEIRSKSFPNIADIEYAILETSGQLSIIPKTEARPVTIKDLNIAAEPSGLPRVVISDGILDIEELKNANKDEKWLRDQLRKNNIYNVKDVFLASVDTTGILFVQTKYKK